MSEIQTPAATQTGQDLHPAHQRLRPSSDLLEYVRNMPASGRKSSR